MKLSTRDRRVIDQFDTYFEENGTPTETLREMIGDLRGREITKPQAASMFHFAAMGFADYAIYQRFKNNDVAELAYNLSLSSRFGYLTRLAGGTDHSGGYDCIHVFDLLKALCAGDENAVTAFLNSFPAPFKKGHGTTILLCNGIYAALEAPSVSLSDFEKPLRNRTESKFFRAMFDCLIAILDEAPGQFAAANKQLANFNRRQTTHSPLKKLICLEAHAMYHLACKKHNELVIEFDAQTDLPWDAEYHKAVSSTELNPIRSFPEVEEIDPEIHRWLLELPVDLKFPE